jgi:hypothetical protein
MSDSGFDMEVISRWEPTGLIDGLPIWEKEELAILYDNTIKLILSNKVISKLPKNVSLLLEECSMPVIRRLYRRIGPNFNLENLLSELLESVIKNESELVLEPTIEFNPIVNFCIDFADNYSDELTSSSELTKEEYTQQVDKVLNYVRKVLLNDGMVSNVDKSDEEWVLKLSDKTKSVQSTRFWNQKMAKDLLIFSLSEINKGLAVDK